MPYGIMFVSQDNKYDYNPSNNVITDECCIWCSSSLPLQSVKGFTFNYQKRLNMENVT